MFFFPKFTSQHTSMDIARCHNSEQRKKQLKQDTTTYINRILHSEYQIHFIYLKKKRNEKCQGKTWEGRRGKNHPKLS